MITEYLFYMLVIGTLLYALYKWATANNDYFVKRKLKHLEPNFMFGNTTGLFLKRYTPADFIDSIYYRYPREKLIGFFDIREPVYLARDLEVIRQITIKDFDSFEDHIGFIDSESDTLFGKSLFMLSEKNWRDMRATLSPAFTGSKMRHMFDLVLECADDMAQYLVEEAKQKPVRWEMKELFSRYTADVIASCAFGLKTNSLKNRTNEFYTIGTNSINFASIKSGLRLLLIRTLPKLMRAINFEFFPTSTKNFFKSMVLETMAEREKFNILRHDVVNILMHVRSGNLGHQNDESHNDDAGFATAEESHIGKVHVKRTWDDDEIISQCFLFFIAGFDTSSTVMSFLAYELAVNQDIQKRLYEEIREVNDTLNGAHLNYDTLSKMKYMDQVISETLRRWPPALFTNRKCTRYYECNIDGNRFFIERGKSIWIPISSIHLDPDIYENPKQFDPERFSDENKNKIQPGSYIPFGIGPRNCIGSRFALMEIKALYFYFLLNFGIQPYEKTQIPVKIGNSTVGWIPENGIHLEFQPRA